MRYERPEEGEWIQPVENGYKLSCCDCGLTHTMDFRIHDGQIQFRAFRDNRATGQVRRHKEVTMSDDAQEPRFNEFREELCTLLNKHSRENCSDTPDFILCRFLSESLAAFDMATRNRSEWYGKKPVE